MALTTAFHNKKFLLTLSVCALYFCQIRAEVSYSGAFVAEEFPVGNMLAWETDFERNSEFFFVERSENGRDFYKIGQIEAAGVTEEGKKYHYLDVGIQAEKVYYRLKQTDTDGTTSLTEIITLHKTLLNEFIVVRMNTTDVVESFICTIDNKSAGVMQYKVLDLANREIEKNEADFTEGLNELNIDTKDLPAGVYKIRLQMNEEIEELVINRVETENKPALRASKESQSNGG